MENMCKVIITIIIIAFTSIILGFFSANLYENDPIWNNAITLISFMMTIFVLFVSVISNLLNKIDTKLVNSMEDTISVLKFNIKFSLMLIITSFIAIIAINYVKLLMCDCCSNVYITIFDSFIIFTISILLETIYDSVIVTLNNYK